MKVGGLCMAAFVARAENQLSVDVLGFGLTCRALESVQAFSVWVWPCHCGDCTLGIVDMCCCV